MRDFAEEFRKMQEDLRASGESDLVVPPPLNVDPLADPSAETPRPEEVRGEVRINGRNMNAVLADLLERS